jgi:starvation-inducible DNA-binding protein
MQDRMPTTTAGLPGINGMLHDQLVADLNRSLATLTDLALAYKQAHWNVLGPDFSPLHAFFDQLADEARGYQDLVAERATTLGGAAHGTVQAAAEYSALPAFPSGERDQTRLLDELAQRVDLVVDQLRRGIAQSEAEPATQDVYVEVVRGVEKQRWMLLAHLTRGGDGSAAREEWPDFATAAGGRQGCVFGPAGGAA